MNKESLLKTTLVVSIFANIFVLLVIGYPHPIYVTVSGLLYAMTRGKRVGEVTIGLTLFMALYYFAILGEGWIDGLYMLAIALATRTYLNKDEVERQEKRKNSRKGLNAN